MSYYEHIVKPEIVVNETIARNNIAWMKERINRSGASFRPHFKTHQSHEIGRWYRDAGVSRITVSSLEMAAFFALDGWCDITVAFPVNIRQHALINELAGKISLGIVAEDARVLAALDRNLEHQITVWLKIDTGYHRTGIPVGNTERIEDCLYMIKRSSHLVFSGFLAHPGHTYQAGEREKVLSVHQHAVKSMSGLADRFRHLEPDMKLSLGDTPSCSIADDFEGIDEWRPGNFVFYDLTQHAIGSCAWDRISAILVCPVVSLHPERSEVVIYGGAIHFSKERLEKNGDVIYGQAVHLTGEGWEPEPTDVVIRKLSQEHGIVSFRNTGVMERVKPGQLMGFYPVHSCLAANLTGIYRTTAGETLGHFSGWSLLS